MFQKISPVHNDNLMELREPITKSLKYGD